MVHVAMNARVTTRSLSTEVYVGIVQAASPYFVSARRYLELKRRIEQEETNNELVWRVHCISGARYARLRRIYVVEIFHGYKDKRADSRCSDKPVCGQLSWCM